VTSAVVRRAVDEVACPVMPRSFETSVESPASVEQFLSAFGNEEFWRARLAMGDTAATLKSLTVDADGTVSVVVAASLLRDRLPKIDHPVAPR
jgi:hypothetical protein